ncbi:MAG: urease subunit beta [Firmicutes bacterium]|nr:urease subunit beta [Bacillota bacterium]
MKHKVGEIIFADDLIEINQGRPVTKMVVTNTGDRTIQVCSHYHFFEANKALKFDREEAFGLHLDIPAGSAIRFEPGEDKEVALTTYAGEGNLYGFLGWTMGNIHDPQVKEKAIAAMKAELEGGE